MQQQSFSNTQLNLKVVNLPNSGRVQKYVDLPLQNQDIQQKPTRQERIRSFRDRLPKPQLVQARSIQHQIELMRRKPVFQRFANDSLQSFIPVPPAAESEVFEEFVDIIAHEESPLAATGPVVALGGSQDLQVSPTQPFQQPGDEKPQKPTHRGVSQLSTSALEGPQAQSGIEQ